MNKARQGLSQPPMRDRKDLEIAPSFPSLSRGLCFQFCSPGTLSQCFKGALGKQGEGLVEESPE